MFPPPPPEKKLCCYKHRYNISKNKDIPHLPVSVGALLPDVVPLLPIVSAGRCSFEVQLFTVTPDAAPGTERGRTTIGGFYKQPMIEINPRSLTTGREEK